MVPAYRIPLSAVIPHLECIADILVARIVQGREIYCKTTLAWVQFQSVLPTYGMVNGTIPHRNACQRESWHIIAALQIVRTDSEGSVLESENPSSVR